MEYLVPAHKRSLFRSPQGYRALPVDKRRSLPLTSDIFKVKMSGSVVQGVYALAECAFCACSMVPVFGVEPVNGKLHSRCFSCEQVYLAAKMRRLLQGPVAEEPSPEGACTCGQPRKPRGKTCGSSACEEALVSASKTKRNDRETHLRRRRNFLDRMGVEEGGILENPCRVCGGLVDMVADYSGLTFVHSGIKESVVGSRRIGSFSDLNYGSCEHEYLALGGAYRTGRDGSPTLMAVVSPQDLRRITSSWAKISKDRANAADK